MKKDILNHLHESNVGYFTHSRWAILGGLKIIMIGFTSIIHGIFPNLFQFTPAKLVIDLYIDGNLDNHPNPKYREYVELKKSLKLKSNSQ
jgi:hypothetical protein